MMDIDITIFFESNNSIRGGRFNIVENIDVPLILETPATSDDDLHHE